VNSFEILKLTPVVSLELELTKNLFISTNCIQMAWMIKQHEFEKISVSDKSHNV
jgi:hypothetical protein